MTRFRKLAIATAGAAVLVALGSVGLWQLDRAYPPPLPQKLTVSAEVLDRDGQLLRTFATPDGYWRLDTGIDKVDRAFIDMLVAYEDKRFWGHSGVDVLALGRAALQFAGNGRIVSGGSKIGRAHV